MVVLRRSKSTSQVHVVTGGGGYVGYRLACELVNRGHQVVLFDIRKPKQELLTSMTFVEGDVRELEAVCDVISGADCVYHVASYGMSGREQLNKKLIEEVNINGTENVLKACKLHGVTRLVYTSTYNVIFGGQVIINGNESLPYLPLDKHPDHYSKTKSIAEKMVLTASGDDVEGGQTLQACALRLAGVYGPGEERHLPRIVSYIEKGMFAFVYGDKESKVDFLHVDNLVQAEVLAGEGLANGVAAGQVYFINDNKPVNNFEFFRPLIEGLGYTYPKLRLPIGLIYFFAIMTEILHSIISPIYNFQPLLTKTEVYKTGVTHYFSIDKAQRELGFHPSKQNDLDDVVEYWIEKGHKKRPKTSKITSYIVDVIIIAIIFSLIMSFLPTVITTCF